MWSNDTGPDFATFRADLHVYGGAGGCCWNSRGVETALYRDQLRFKMPLDKQHRPFQWDSQEWLSWKCSIKYKYFFRAALYSKILDIQELLLTSFHHGIEKWQAKLLSSSFICIFFQNKSALFIYLLFHLIIFSLFYLTYVALIYCLSS